MTVEFSYTTTTSESDWNEWATQNVEVGDGGIHLERTTTIRESELGSAVVDHAVDPTGVLYTIRSSGALYRYDPHTDLHQRLFDRTDNPLDDPCAICAGDTHVFVADAADGTITSISPGLQRTVGTVQSDTIESEPVELTADGETIYALDRDERIVTVGRDDDPTIDVSLAGPIDLASDGGHLYVLDHDEQPVVRAFHDDRELRNETYPMSVETFVVDDKGTFTPTAITASSGAPMLAGSFDDRDGHGLFVWNPDTNAFEQHHEFDAPCVGLTGYPASNGDRHAVYAVIGEDRTCHALTEVAEYARHPHRDRHVGMAFYRYDSGARDTEWHRLTLEHGRSAASTQVRVRYYAADDPTTFPLEADRIEPGVVETLREAGVDTIWELATADVDRLVARSEQFTPPTVRSWQEAALSALSPHVESDWTSVDTIDPDDILLKNATGRYLFVAIELIGTPTSTPLIESVTAFCPRRSYLRYLPELYQQDDRSADFLERFLSVFETSFVEIESEIERLGRYFDPYGVPSESLSWLERWLALEEYRDWPESARRELLARAPELYKKRGTKAGLRDVLELYLRHATPERVTGAERGRSPVDGPDSSSRARAATTTGDDEVAATTAATADGGENRGQTGDLPTGHRLFFLEPADLDRIDNEATRQQYASMLPSGRSFALFCGPFESDDQRDAVETIVRTEIPAHVTARVVSIDDEFTLGGDTFLGLNSALTTREFAMGEAMLGEDTVLGSRSSAE